MMGNVILGVPLAFTILANLAVALRFYVRTKLRTAFSWDDWTMLLATVIEIVNRGLTTASTVYAYRVPLSAQDGVQALKYNYVALPFQVAVSVIARLSITILLIRLFGVHRWFRRSVTALFAVVALLSIAFIPMTFAQVTPTQALWDPTMIVTHRWQPQVWVDYAAFTQSAYTVSDLVLVALPVMIVWNLNMPLHQKVGLVLILLLGLLAMVMSIMRTVWIVLSYSSNSTLGSYNQTAILTLALLEGDMVIIIGCIPTLRSLFNQNLTGRWSFQSLFTRSKPDSRQQTKKPAAGGTSGSTGPYHDLELSTRELGANHIGNIQISTAHFKSSNRSDDYLVKKGQVRKVENFSVTYNSAGDV